LFAVSVAARRRRKPVRGSRPRAARETRRRLLHWRQARRACAVAALEPVAQLPELRNGAPPLVALQRACAEIVVKTAQPRGTIQEASDTAVEMNQI
jgi:hypothetical protein